MRIKCVRGQALLLLAVLTGGGIVAPTLDATCFHLAALDARGGEHPVARLTPSGQGASHVTGCAILATARTGSGLPSVAAWPVRVVAHGGGPAPAIAPTLSSRSDLSLAFPRAPPAA